MLSRTVELFDHGVLGRPARGFLPRSIALWAAAAYVALFIIRPWELLIPELSEIRFERSFALAMIVIVGLTNGFRLELNRQNVAVLAFCLAMGVTSMLAYNSQLAWNASYRFFTQIACYLVLISVIRSPYELLFITAVYIGCMEIYVAKAMWEFFLHGAGRQGMGVWRLRGIEETFGHPNTLANSIVVSLPIWLALWSSRREILVNASSSWRKLVVWGLAVYPAIGVIGVLLTNSRTGMVNLCCFVFLAKLERGRSLFRSVIFVLLVVGVGWIAIPQEQKLRIQSIWNASINESAETSKQSRIESVRVALGIFQEFPLAGIGPGNFGHYRNLNVDGIDLEPHNLIGQMLAEMGIVGSAAFAVFVGVLVSNCRRTRFVAQDSNNPTLQTLTRLATAFMHSTILLLVAGLAGHNLYRFNWLWLAAFSALAARFAIRIRSDEAADYV